MSTGIPPKWQFFRITNYLHIVAASGILVVMITIIKSVVFFGTHTLLLFIFSAAGILILLANSVINLLLLEKYYPDKLPGKILLKLHTVLLIFSILFSSLIIFITAAQLPEVISPETDNPMQIVQKIIFIFYFIISLTSLPVYLLQIRMRKLLRWNYDSEIDRFLHDENP